MIEVFNKAQIEWVRRQLVGTNILKQGDEQSLRRVDDLNILLKVKKLNLNHFKLYDESNTLPFLTSEDYMAFKRLEVYAISECCPEPRLMTIYPGEEANVIHYLTDENLKPSLTWGETFSTMVGRKIRIYTNGEFSIKSAELMYYRQPRRIQVLNCSDPYSGTVSTTDVLCEFKDDIVEVLIDDAAAIVLGDIENYQNMQREKQNAENNN